MRKLLLLLIPLFLISFQSNAQFKKLIKHAKEKAMDAVLGEDDQTDSSHAQQDSPQTATTPQEQTEVVDQDENQPAKEQPKVKAIDFPVTGDTVTATHCVYQWVIDTAAVVKAILKTPQGKYCFKLAREKGLKGANEQIFQQLMDPKNQEITEEIKAEVEAKFPEKKVPKGYRRKVWSNSAWAGRGMVPLNSAELANNPAWGGISIPSLYFDSWGGDCGVWMTDNYIKSATLPGEAPNHGPTLFTLFGINAAGIYDLNTNISYSIGSVLGVKFTQVHKMNFSDSDSSGFNILHLIGVAKKFWPVPGIRYEPGSVGKFGKYNTISGKLIIPVRPFTDPYSGEQSDALLVLHDLLSSRNDAGDPRHPHYDPSYKIIYEYYFTHDIDQYIPPGILDKLKADGFKNGFCVGAKLEDEKGNSANYRLTQIQADQTIDKGQFQIPEDYPVMTQDELNEALKDHFKLKNIFKRALKKGRIE